MGHLHYGSQLRISLDEATMQHTMEQIAAHATRGGWVSATDTAGREWSFLVSAGIPIWVDARE